MGDLLQGLFREAYSLQKCLMELLDKISLESSASEEEISDIVTGLFHFLSSYSQIFFRIFFRNVSLDLLTLIHIFVIGRQ